MALLLTSMKKKPQTMFCLRVKVYISSKPLHGRESLTKYSHLIFFVINCWRTHILCAIWRLLFTSLRKSFYGVATVHFRVKSLLWTNFLRKALKIILLSYIGVQKKDIFFSNFSIRMCVCPLFKEFD